MQWEALKLRSDPRACSFLIGSEPDPAGLGTASARAAKPLRIVGLSWSWPPQRRVLLL